MEQIQVCEIPQINEDFEDFFESLWEFYQKIINLAPDYLMASSKESIKNAVLKGDTVITAINNKGKFKIVGFAKISAYINNQYGQPATSNDTCTTKIAEIGNVMTDPEYRGLGIATNSVIKCMQIAKQKYPDFWPIAVVHHANKESLAVFRKLAFLGGAAEMPDWPKPVEHSEHGEHLFKDWEEYCFNLSIGVLYLEAFKINLLSKPYEQ